MGREGEERAIALVHHLDASERIGAKHSLRMGVFLATDSQETKQRFAEESWAGPLLFAEKAAVHSAGREDQTAQEAEASSGFEQVVGEWWTLAGADKGWVLTRASSFGMTAALMGRFGGKWTQNWRRAEPLAESRPEARTTSAGEVWTVHEHKISSGVDCTTFQICALSPPDTG
eukprot:1072277-Rhodomonas_salina.1